MWISGVHPVEEVLRRRPNDVEAVVSCRREESIREIVELASLRAISVQQVSREALNQLVGYRQHQGVAARLRLFPYEELSAFLNTPGGVPSPLVLLDSLEDPQNLGAILRSAAFFGVRGVLIPAHRSVSITDAVSRVSAGALSMVTLVRVPNLVSAMDTLTEEGFTLVGLDAHAPRMLYGCPLDHPLAVVLGNEHRGMRRLVRERCHLLVSIPRVGEMESLNVAAAAAVAFAEVARRSI